LLRPSPDAYTADSKQTTVSIWANQLLERKPARLVTVAVANKMARIAWAVMARQEDYRARPATA
jgi:transposase